MPVSEYTGIPSISVPLYQIEVDGVTLPITLSYHAGGVRVDEEASWIGLGWNLSFGSVIQTVNDVDDYLNVTNRTRVQMLPDFYSTPLVEELPLRYNWPYSTDGQGWSSPVEVYEPTPAHGYKIATGYYVPVNGDYETKRETLFTSEDVDSEPDVFKANFLGHSLNMVRDFRSGEWVVLNKRGYQVSYQDDRWLITTPAGEQFHFEEKSVIESRGASENFTAVYPTSWHTSIKMWMLTSIVTKNKKEISITYSRAQTLAVEGYPKFFQKQQKPTYLGSSYQTTGPVRGLVGQTIPVNSEGVFTTTAYSRETFLYPASITFPKGSVTFTTVARQDMAGTRALDSVKVRASETVKVFKLNHSYFDASSVGGNGYHFPEEEQYGLKLPMLRLKLLSVQEDNGTQHTFKYNETPLPKKNSFARDYWGYYNGQLSNNSVVPNPYRFKNRLTSLEGQPDNGNNMSANLFYVKAGVLEEITYPTGGKAVFNYELNEFDSYWVPDYNVTTNQVSHGLGLRIASIKYLDLDDEKLKETVYHYGNGKAILPMDIFRQYNVKTVDITSTENKMLIYDFQINESNASGMFSANPFGSLSGVGYGKVTRREISSNGSGKGRTETIFHNSPDIVTHSYGHFSQMSATLPAFKNINFPENGSIKSVTFFNEDGDSVKLVEKEYMNVRSMVRHGARIFSHGGLAYQLSNCGDSVCPYTYQAQNLVGYYPIFDVETLLSSTKETLFTTTGNIATSTSYSYDSTYNLVTSTLTASSRGEVKVAYSYPWNSDATEYGLLMSAGRPSEVVGETKYNRSYGTDTFEQVSHFSKAFGYVGSRILEKNISEYTSATSLPRVTFFDKHDERNGNLLQFHREGKVPISYLWGYDAQYVIAEAKHANYNELFFDSFEEITAWGSNISYDENRSQAGRVSGRISSSSGEEKVQIGDRWLNFSLSAPKIFRYSGWVYSNGPSADIHLYMKRGGETELFSYADFTSTNTTGKWVYIEKEVQVPADVVKLTLRLDNNGLGDVWFDNLRICPADAQMTTYIYDPLVGMTSSTDANGRTTYYVYDSFGRLKAVKDHEGNVLNSYEYHYAGQ
ncbi:RHS repeat domain-containing protein [Pontibacter ummariensis]|uniref:RHS repeat domain-containing protein n=1 Tax=Pontibacter ummariensis TaxID=1610492 RepID=UPI001C52C304|nr:RHS repeat domain-containing protein [Pontibacter ummariensis]